MTVIELAQMGGVFALLVFCHFVVDWLFQSHDEAMKKSVDSFVRARHCLIYTFGFVPLLWALKLNLIELSASVVILFVSHFFEDTYYPVMLWVKHVRRPPEFRDMTIEHFPRTLTDKEAFIKWFSTPLGKIIGIVVDQLIHITFLLPIAYFAV